jgi:hypothetical protein
MLRTKPKQVSTLILNALATAAASKAAPICASAIAMADRCSAGTSAAARRTRSMSRSWRRFGAFGRCSRKAIAAARFRQLV